MHPMGEEGLKAQGFHQIPKEMEMEVANDRQMGSICSLDPKFMFAAVKRKLLDEGKRGETYWLSNLSYPLFLLSKLYPSLTPSSAKSQHLKIPSFSQHLGWA